MSTSTLAGWELERLLGQGAFGETWEVVGPDGSRAALKRLPTPPGEEMRALARVCHPCVIEVKDAGAHPEPFLVMELATGVSLDQLDTPALDRALAIGAAVLDALAAVHAAGIVHGDVKPANLMVDLSSERTRVKLVDFGLVGIAQGGTLQYASPERLGGAPASAPADTYAAGLLLWELVHGAAPWADLPVEEALLKRRSQCPTPEAGPTWVQELLVSLLHPDPTRRITADAAADVLAAHEVPLPEADASLLRRRARTLHVASGVDSSIAAWLAERGHLALVGARTTGRSHQLDIVATQLASTGETFVRWAPGPAWEAVTDALRTPRLPGPPTALPPATLDLADRAYEAARAIVRRAAGPVRVLVDDLDAMDTPSLRVLSLLSSDSAVSICSAGTEPPSWDAGTAHLEPWSRDQAARWVEGLLGDTAGNADALVDHAMATSAGNPGVVVDVGLAAVASGAVVRRARRWLVDADRVARVQAVARADLSSFDAPTTEVGAALAAYGSPLDRADLARLTERPRAVVAHAVGRLHAAGVVRLDADRVRIASPAVSAALLARSEALAVLHARIASMLGPDPTPRLAHHLVEAGDRAALDRVAAPAIARAIRTDRARAAELADRIWALHPTRDVGLARAEALVNAGRGEEACALAASLTAEHPDDVALLKALALARLATDAPLDARTAIQSAIRAAGDEVPLDLREIEARCAFFAGEHREAERIAMRWTARFPDTDDARDDWLRLKGLQAQATHARGDLASAVELLESLPEGLGRGRPARTLLDATLGRLLWHAGRSREAEHRMAGAARRNGGLGAIDRARLANNAALASYGSGDNVGAVEQWERAQLLLERVGSVAGVVATRLNLCLGYCELGRWERSRTAGEWALAKAEELALHPYVAMAHGNLGDLCRERGAPADARVHYDHAIRVAAEHDLMGDWVENLRRRASLAVETGSCDAEALLEEAANAAEQHKLPAEQGLVTAWWAVWRARTEPERAMELLARARFLISPLDDARLMMEWRYCAAEARAVAGETHRARTDLAKVVAYAEETASMRLRTRAETLSASLGVTPTRPGEEALLDLAMTVARTPDPETVLPIVVQTAQMLSHADRAFLVSSDGEVLAAAPLDTQAEPSWSIARRAMDEGRDVIVADLGDRPDLRASTSVMVLRLTSVMCVPIVAGEKVVGALYVDSRTASEEQLLEVGRQLRALAGFAGIALHHAREQERHLERSEAGAGLVHDIRNMVGVLQGVAADVQEECTNLPESVGTALAHVESVSDHLIRMAQGFLDGRDGPPRRIALEDVTRELVSVLGAEARSRGLDLVLDSSCSGTVVAREDEVRRALFNLLHNAMKFAGNGGEVRVQLDENDGWAQWSVRDTGVGLPGGVLPPRIGSRREVDSEHGGHGLGLAVAIRAVHEAGGVFCASNHPDGGAVFELRLPLSEPVAPSVASPLPAFERVVAR